MRLLLVISMLGCAEPRPAPTAVPTTAPTTSPTPRPASAAPAPPPPPPVSAPALSARELIEAAGLASFRADRALLVAQIDDTAMERWFSNKPGRVFLYTERALETPDPKVTIRGRCQQVAVEAGGVLNALAVVAWRRGDDRVVLELGQDGVGLLEEQQEGGAWSARGVRRLPLGAVAWKSGEIRYAQDATSYEVACVPAVREVACGATGLRGYCLDRELVVRPWLPAFVPHVGEVIPAYSDPVPEIPTGACAVTCGASACEEALRTQPIPRAPLYEDAAPALAAFRTEAACRAFAATRPRSAEGAW